MCSFFDIAVVSALSACWPLKFVFCYVCLCSLSFFFFFKQKTAYEVRISDWSSDVCSSDLELRTFLEKHPVVYPIAVVDVYDPPADFATPRGLPMTYLIAPGGKVAKQFLGPVTAKDIEGAIAAAGGPAVDAAADRKSTRLNSRHYCATRMPSSA